MTDTMLSYVQSAHRHSRISVTGELRRNLKRNPIKYMKGLEICEKYYRLYGESLFEKYPELMRRAATGLVGEGSECLGFDDEISRDHDFDFGFCIWLADEDERDYGFALSRAYASLPKEFMGLKRAADSPVGALPAPGSAQRPGGAGIGAARAPAERLARRRGGDGRPEAVRSGRPREI